MTSFKYLHSMFFLYLLVSGMLLGEAAGDTPGDSALSVGEAASETRSPRLEIGLDTSRAVALETPASTGE